MNSPICLSSNKKKVGSDGVLLGISFYNGKISRAIDQLKEGGLLTAPSGPGLSKDLVTCTEYKNSLQNSDIVLADSGLLCLWEKIFGKGVFKRISGLTFLKSFLERVNWNEESCLWVMPDMDQAKFNKSWLEKKFQITIQEKSVYIAPIYAPKGKLADKELLMTIEKTKPKYIFIQLGGGVQERLGNFLKNNLSYKPSILCTGAAIAFLSGLQAKIPNWADKSYLGWLLRCFQNPRVFVPRYLSAVNLLYLLFRYGQRPPKLDYN